MNNAKLFELLIKAETLSQTKAFVNEDCFHELTAEMTKNLRTFGGFGPNQECAANSGCSSNGSCLGNSNCQYNDICTGMSNSQCPIR